MQLYIGLFFFFGTIAFLLPNHYFPWTAFHNEIAAFISAAILIIAVGARENHLYFRTNFPTILGFTAFFAAVNIFTPNPGQAIYYIYPATAVVIYICIRHSSKDTIEPLISALWYALLIAGLITTFIILLQSFASVESFLIADIRAGSRPYGNLAQPNNAATLLLLGIIAVIGLYLQGKFSAILFSLLAILFVVGVSLTQSRTAILGMFIVAIFLVACGPKSFRHKNTNIFFGITVFLLGSLAAVTYVTPDVKERLYLNNSSVVDRGVASNERLIIWRELSEAVKDRPLTGYGYHNVGEAIVSVSSDTDKSIYTEYSHNFFLDLVVWFGLPLGAVIILGLTFWIFSRIHRCNSANQWLSLAGIIVVFTHSMLELPHAYAYFLIPLAMMAGMVDRQGKPGKLLVMVPASAIRAVGFAGLALCVVATVDYLRIEESYRDMRFTNARIGLADKAIEVPKTLLFPELADFINFAGTEAREDMSQEELAWMQRVAHNKAFPPSLFRYALALGLNHQAEAAALELRRLKALHGVHQYDEARELWMGLTYEYPQLANVFFPESSFARELRTRNSD